MTDNEKVITVQLLLDNDEAASKEVVMAYLALAKSKMLRRLYPFDSTQTEIPKQYETDQCELAVRLFLKRGAEGESSHSENSVSRTYGSVDEEDILSRLTPYAKVIS